MPPGRPSARTAGRRAWLEDPFGNTTSWTYDDAGRRKSQTNPLGKATSYGFHDADRLVSVTDRLSRRREFTRDDAGRVTAEAWYSAANSLVQRIRPVRRRLVSSGRLAAFSIEEPSHVRHDNHPSAADKARF